MIYIGVHFTLISKWSGEVRVAQPCLTLWSHGLYSPWNSPGQNRVGSLSLLQGIFPTQEWKPGLPHYRWILYQLSHKGSPRILEWVVYRFCMDLPDPGIKPGSPASQVDSLPNWSGKPSSVNRVRECKLFRDVVWARVHCPLGGAVNAFSFPEDTVPEKWKVLTGLVWSSLLSERKH